MSAFSGAFSSGIANLSGVFTSGALNMSTHLHIILPEPDKMRGTLLLLHGLKGGSEDWQRKTSIERYAAEYGLAVFMPEVQRMERRRRRNLSQTRIVCEQSENIANIFRAAKRIFHEFVRKALRFGTVMSVLLILP